MLPRECPIKLLGKEKKKDFNWLNWLNTKVQCCVVRLCS